MNAILSLTTCVHMEFHSSWPRLIPTRDSQTVIFAGKLREAKEARKMEIQAREARHGDRLRMSSSGAKRDPLLDENEDDWVRMSIIAGWSHGYLQMVSLLPAAEKVIAMHAEWIVEAFEIAAAKEERASAQGTRTKASSLSSTRASPTPVSFPRTASDGPVAADDEQTFNVIPPTPVVPASATLAPSLPPSPQKDTLKVEDTSALSDGEDDEILTFTPKNRRASSNASRGSMGSGSPPVLPYNVSPPSLSPDPMEFNEPTTLPPSRDGQYGLPAHLVTSVERAMREQPSRRSYSIPGSTTSSRPQTPVRMNSNARATSSTSPNPSRTSRPERTLSLSPPPAPTTAASSARGRSPSGSGLPKPQGAIFIDARDLMRRRKEDVVFGIVSGAGSRTSSPPPRKSSHAGRTADGGEGDGGAQVDRRRTVE